MMSVQLNGIGGYKPNVDIVQADEIRMLFKKNNSAVVELTDYYKVSIAPSAGNELIAYATLRIIERPIPD